jgi:hypothetical protein
MDQHLRGTPFGIRGAEAPVTRLEEVKLGSLREIAPKEMYGSTSEGPHKPMVDLACATNSRRGCAPCDSVERGLEYASQVDPISTIVMALTAGAASVATSAVKDTYAGLKGLIERRYSSVPLDVLESDPASAARQTVVSEELNKTHAASDPEVLELAKTLLHAVGEAEPGMADAIGVDLERIRAAELTIERILAEGSAATGVQAADVEVAGTVSISDVEARGSAEPKKKRNR